MWGKLESLLHSLRPSISTNSRRVSLVEASLPTARHFTRMLRILPNAVLQWLLDDTVRLLQVTLRDVRCTILPLPPTLVPLATGAGLRAAA